MPAAYPEEFRRSVVDLVRESEESVSAVARRLVLGISNNIFSDRLHGTPPAWPR